MTAPDGTPKHKPNRSIDRGASVKRLKAFYKVTLPECGENPGDTVAKETDRGAVILLSTAVEDMLARRIKHEMIDLTSDETSRLFGPDAPIGSFSAKIKLAHAFGYIDRDVARMCDLVREMRNACAHSGRALSFVNEELAEVMGAAYSYISDERVISDAYDKLEHLGKVHFIWLTAWLLHTIRTGSKDDATVLINNLIAEATADADRALKKRQASQKRRRERSSPRDQ